MNENVVERIRKLLRLGRGTNHDAERDAALAKAAELAAEAGLDIGGIDADGGGVRVTHERTPLVRRSHARTCVHSILREHFGVTVVSGWRGCVYIGPRVNIEIARHIEVFLLREASGGWARHRKGLRRVRDAGRRRKQWTHGFFCAVATALRARPLRNDAEALRAAVDRYMAEHFDVKHRKGWTPPRVSGAVVAGWDDGKQVNLARPVETAAFRSLCEGRSQTGIDNHAVKR